MKKNDGQINFQRPDEKSIDSKPKTPPVSTADSPSKSVLLLRKYIDTRIRKYRSGTAERRKR